MHLILIETLKAKKIIIKLKQLDLI